MSSLGSLDEARMSRALAALEKSRVRLEEAEQERNGPIAIVGAGCRLPGSVNDLRDFWRLLSEGRDAVTTVPEERWHTTGIFDADPDSPGRISTPAMGVLDDALGFDASFFGIAPREAAAMDPQHRVLLEVTWEALESAGISLAELRGSATGVFVGISANEFGFRTPAAEIDMYAATGRALSTASGRIAYVFGLEGPALSIDTACSSSLVAVHLACQSLRRRESNLALAAGVHVSAGPEGSIGLSKLKALSPTGRCRTFSSDADGCVRGEGCGVAVLKRLADAISDGDQILAVIRASGVNQDGRSNGFTAPSRGAQESLLRAVLERAKLAPVDVGYVEAHGTGTALGDPIEIGALATVHSARPADRPLWVGSAKSNLGHLEAAAGITGLLKAALVLRERRIPRSLHFTRPNPLAEWDTAPIRVVTEPQPLPTAADRPSLVGINSFGFSGTNAHALLEAAPARGAGTAGGVAVDWLALSARGEAALRARAQQFATLIEADPSALPALCRASRRRTAQLGDKLAVVAADASETVGVLRAFAAGQPSVALQSGGDTGAGAGRIAFVFSGQGGQWLGMGRKLHARSERFRAAFTACDQAIQRRYGWSVADALQADEAGAQLTELPTLQPLLFSLAVALAAHVEGLGLRPDGVLGHSMGEIAAAHVAGALSLEQAVQIVCDRSRLLATSTGGAMALVELGPDEARQVIADHGAVSIAALNGPRSTVLSGRADAMAPLLARLQERGIYTRPIAGTECASHSPLMEPLLDPLIATLEGVTPVNAPVEFYSTVTESRAAGTDLGPAYWARNVRETVRFHGTIRQMLADGFSYFLEIGPHPVLTPAIDEIFAEPGEATAAHVAAVMRRGEPEERTTAAAVGRLYVQGAQLRADRMIDARIDLPAYPWQHEAFALPKPRLQGRAMASGHALLGSPVPSSARAGRWLFEGVLPADHVLVTQHRAHGAKLLPATAYLEMALSAGRQLWQADGIGLFDVKFQRALTFADDDDNDRIIELELTESGKGRGTFRVSSRDEGASDWIEHARGMVRTLDPAGPATPATDPAATPAAMMVRLARHVDGSDVYAALEEVGFNYGPRFQRVAEVWAGPAEVLCRLAAEPAPSRVELSAPLLDAALHGLAWLGIDAGADLGVPVSIAELRVQRSHIDGRPLFSHAAGPADQAGDADGASLARRGANIRLLDETGDVLVELRGLRAVDLPTTSAVPSSWLHGQGWQRKPSDPAAGPKGPERWLALALSHGARAVLDPLSARLGNCKIVSAGLARAEVERVVQEHVLAAPVRPDGVLVVLEGLGQAADEQPSPGQVALLACQAVLHVMQAILAVDPSWSPVVALVTRASQDVEQSITNQGIGTAAVWGLARTLSVEHPDLCCRCIDLPAPPSADEIDRLAAELRGDRAETEVALRAERWVGRLQSAAWPSPPELKPRGPRGPFRLELDRPGVLGSMVLREHPRRPPGKGEVEIRVAVAALNFADVMHAMGFFGDHWTEASIPLGSECAGEVVALGEGVDHLRVGQAVVALGVRCFATHVTTSADLVRSRPQGVTADDAAGLPIAAMTALHALTDVARVKPGDRVLIHSASGGTGLAALQIARGLGAEVFATAGSPAKRDFLRGCGVQHVFDSRSLDFADEILACTGGQGVDVVLNSLSGQALERSLAILGNDGRFVEIGKRDIFEGGRLPLEHFKRRISFSAVDLGGMERQRPERFRELFARVMNEVEAGRLRPLPCTIVPISRALSAFQTMVAAEHIGKVLLSLDDPAVETVAGGVTFAGTQLITGGMGGLGLELATWLVDQGARHLVLTGRSQPGPTALARIQTLRERGVRVEIVRADAGRAGDLARAVDAVSKELPPIRGIFHLAAVLSDGLVAGLSCESFPEVLGAKIGGAWALHRLALDLDLELDHFVLYSSAAAIVPAPAQANYAAANAAMDALAAHRRSLGLPASSIQWGPFVDAGRAATEARGRLADRGAGGITVARAHQVLRHLLAAAPATIGIFPFKIDRWLEFNPAMRGLLRLGGLAAGSDRPDARSAAHDELKSLAAEARLPAVTEIVAGHLAAVLRQNRDRLPTQTTFSQLGLDSLTGLELRNRLEGALGIRLSATLLWRHPTLTALATHLTTRLFPEANPPNAESAPTLASAARADAWFLVPAPVANPRARLFCFPYLGGLASIFSPWAKRLPADIELRALQLPGRPPRTTETPINQLEPLLDAICAAVAPFTDRPYAFYGHSLGALTAYEVACGLRRRGLAPPSQLFLAAYPAPDAAKPVGRIHDLPAPELAAALSHLGGIPAAVLEDKELLALFLPSLRADLTIVHEYRYAARRALALPATLFAGDRDHLVSRPQLQAWQARFELPIAVEVVPGGHLFIKEAEVQLLARIETDFLRRVPAARTEGAEAAE
jgi:acyl transferase domain-containing protein/surfactin synthase thioesterase subunit/NADPH:quinone reductase-like Zn-dependent oxidoreductase/NAD(P)-dependent dehydrogenase (short-subunit alcohol dehydrogenase family)/acyl carrier protein